MRIKQVHAPTVLLIVLGVAGVLGYGRAARAQCSTVPESGVWYNQRGDDPYKIEVDQPVCNDSGGPSSTVWHVRVWTRQPNGNLFERGRHDAALERRSDRTTWIVVKGYLGGSPFMEHLSLQRTAAGDNMRAWIWRESLDARPSSGTYHVYARKLPPPPVKAIVLRRSTTTGVAGPPRTMCERARDARARNSLAAPNLEAQCRALQAQGRQ